MMSTVGTPAAFTVAMMESAAEVMQGLIIRASTPWVMKVLICSFCLDWSLLPSTVVTL